MERRFLIHKRAEDFTLADKTGIGIRAAVAPSEQFSSWEAVYEWCRAHGATVQSLEVAAKQLDDNLDAELVISDYQDAGT